MRFGFHAYHKSFKERFSQQNLIFFLLVSLFIVSMGAVIAFTYIKSDTLTMVSFATEQETVAPIPENYTAPLSQSKKITNKRNQVIGFLPSWTIAQNVKVYPEYLDQIIYFGIGIDEQGNLMKYDENNDWLVEWSYLNSEYFKLLQEDSKKTSTKITVAIKNFDNTKIDTLISNETYTNNAVAQLKELVQDYDLDGINIDFEYFSDVDFPTLQYYNRFLTKLTTELREVKPDAIISVDVNATVVYNDNAYDMVKIGEVVDQVIIMGYDYHTAGATYAGAVSPIDSDEDRPSIRKTIKSLEGRVDKNKLILGIPFYGYEWQTLTENQNSKTVPETGAVATYKRVRQLIASRDDVTLHFDEKTLSPWLSYNQNGLIKQIYYEDEKSLVEKIKFVELNGLEGIAIWALGYEGEYVEPWTVIKENIRGKK